MTTFVHKGEGGHNCLKFCPRGLHMSPKITTLNLFNLSKYKGILEEFYSLLKIKSKSPKVFENASIHFEGNVVVYKFY